MKKRAIQEKLIWTDGSIFEKTEIRNTEEKRKLENLNQKFELEDEFFEDYTLPYETEIHYSKANNYAELGISILIVGVGIYFFNQGENKHYVFGVIMSGIGLYGTIKESRKAFNTKPQIIINSRGIQTRNVEFKNWLNIAAEEVVQEGFGDSTKFYLTYFYDDDGFEKIEIDSLNITHRELQNIIRTYWIRYKKNYS